MSKDRIDKDQVFLDPMVELELSTGDTLTYPKLMGMKKEAQTYHLINKMCEKFKIKPDDLLTIVMIEKVVSKFESEVEAGKFYDAFWEITARIIGKDVDFVDRYFEFVDAFEVVSLFFFEKTKRRFEAQKRVFKTLGIDTSMELPAESGTGVSKKQTKLQKKK